jgi:hypothetical protein
MNRKLIFCGVLWLAVLSLLPVRLVRAQEEEGEEEEDKRPARFAVIEVSDEEEKISYEVTPMRATDKWMEHRREQGKRAKDEWKKLPSAERKQTPEPALVKTKVVKQNIKTEEEAKAIAERLLERVPKNKRAGEVKTEKGSKDKTGKSKTRTETE